MHHLDRTPKRHWRCVMAAAVVAFGTASVDAGEAPTNRPEDGALVKVGEVDGRTFDLDRSSFDARGTAFVTRRDDDVSVWDARTLERLTDPLAHAGVKAFVLNGDGKTVLTRDAAEVRLWDVATSKPRTIIRAVHGELKFAEVSPDGARVVTVEGGDVGHVNLWRAADGRLERRLVHPGKRPLASAQFDPTGTRVVSYRDSETFMVHDLHRPFNVGPPVEALNISSYPYSAKLDPRGGQFAIPRVDDFMIVDCETGLRTITSGYHGDGNRQPRVLYFSADGSRVSMTFDMIGDRVSHSYDADTGKFQHAFAPGLISRRLFGPGGRLAICVASPREKNRPAELWDIEAGKVLQRIFDERPMDVSPDGKTVLFRVSGGRTSVWRLKE
jgi:hypothetical protein